MTQKHNRMKNIRILIVLFGLILSFTWSCKPRKASEDHNISWIRFDWEGDSVGNRYYEKLAMFVPFRIAGIPYNFSAQFDLGAPVTMIYGNTFTPLLQKFPAIAGKLDTIHKRYVIQGKKVGGFTNISFYLDTVLFRNQDVAFFKGYGEPLSGDQFKKDTVIHIGTIGSSLFSNKTLIIDFKHNRLAILDSLSNSMGDKLVDIIIEKGRIKVPILVNGEKVYVIYDTGSSFSSLYLSAKNWDRYRDTTSMPDSIMVSAWGTEYPLFISKTDIEIRIGNSVFHPETVMANDLKPYHDFFKREKIIGLMGNQLFYNKILVIDFRNKKFGLIDEPQLTQL